MVKIAKAHFVAVGKDLPEYVDKHQTNGKTFTKKELIESQLRGEINPEGELYGKSLAKRIRSRYPEGEKK